MSFEKTAVPYPGDTIVAVSSASGPGLRAVIRVSGPAAGAVVAQVFQGNELPRPRRFVRGSLRLTGVPSPLPATLYFFAAPRSYTGQDVAELHTISSPPLVERLVADVLAAGARPACPGEFTLRAFLAGKKDLPQAEAVQAVIEAGTDADLTAALAQLAGGVSRPLEVLRNDLLNLLADVEAALDFADENIAFVAQPELRRRLQTAITQLEAVHKQLDERTVSGRPVRIVLVGPPNAGKSSLFNALTGSLALVSPIPGTTRDYLVKPLELGGIVAELIDTAGWHDATDPIDEQSQRLGCQQSARADVVVWCDEHGNFGGMDESRLATIGAVVLKVRTKADRLAVADRLPVLPPPLEGAGQRQGCSVTFASIVTPDGLDALRVVLGDVVAALTRPPLAPSQSRCRHHVLTCLNCLREAHALAADEEQPELLALALRSAIDALGEMTGAVYTNDLLDRIFSRFCIGK